MIATRVALEAAIQKWDDSRYAVGQTAANVINAARAVLAEPAPVAGPPHPGIEAPTEPGWYVVAYTVHHLGVLEWAPSEHWDPSLVWWARIEIPEAKP